MNLKKPLLVYFALFLISGSSLAQTILIKGNVIDSDNKQPITGASVSLKGDGTTGTATDANGDYSISIPDQNAILVFSHVGFTSVEEQTANRTQIDVTLKPEITPLNEIVVIGYGTQIKKDLTGAVSSVQLKDFNNGNFTSPDLLIQGRVAGVQITSSSGQPGAVASIKIRGNSVLTGTGQPLFVVDGIPLSGSSARPNINNDSGTSPAGNPLNFINPSDIISMDVLKDASATAIYGSRAAYGVIIITTKKGQVGEPKIDFAFSTGLAHIRNQVDVLNASQYRTAIPYYGVSSYNDKGGYADGLASILRTGKQQNYSMGISGGNENGTYRFSLGYYDQEGIINKSEIKKYNANVSANLKFLKSKKLRVDINLMSSQYVEDLPPLRNEGSIVQTALGWNPTDSLRKADGSLNIHYDAINPLALSELYNDNSKVTTIVGSIAPRYEFTEWLEFKMLISVNYGSGERRASLNQAFSPGNGGLASIYNNENSTNQITNTLTFHKEVFPDFNIAAVTGYEYLNFTSKGSALAVSGPQPGGFGNFGLDYTNYIQFSNSKTRSVSSFVSPSNELQSYFGRAIFNYKDSYLLTFTFRADGSTKFGDNNKYGYFPSFSAAWIVSNERFFNIDFVKTLKLRMGWGKTGNQEFPAGSSKALYGLSSNGGINQINNPNPNLKWQADTQFNIGVDFSILKNRVSGTLDFFQKTTSNLLYPNNSIQPAPPGTGVTWINLDGNIQNTGLEATLNLSLVNTANVIWDFGLNATFLKNRVSGLPSPIYTGDTFGGATQIIQNGFPMNTFYTRKYLGIDPTTGLAVYEDNENTFYHVGNPNPSTLLGINSTFRFKKISFTMNMYGALGQTIYNLNLNNVINVGNINGGGNIALSEFKSPVKESVANPMAPSSRYIEKGDYLKMGNATLAYNMGNIGNVFKQVRFYVTGQNLFSITHYSGNDAEVNTDRNINGVPSLGLDNQVYPSARTVIIGMNFSLQ